MLNLYYFIIFFISGLIIGSFLNSLIYRIDDIKTIFIHRSHCPKCQKILTWKDLIPLISFLILLGRCRYCRQKISWQYPLLELATALMFVVIYWQFGLSLVIGYWLLVTCFLILIFTYDWLKQIIPDEFFYPALILTVIFLIFSPRTDFSSSILGMLAGSVFIALIYLITRGKGIGFADIKLTGLLGLIVGWPQILLVLFLAFILGAMVGLIMIASRKYGWKSAIAFGPFLIMGFYITLFWGEKIIGWYLGI